MSAALSFFASLIIFWLLVRVPAWYSPIALVNLSTDIPAILGFSSSPLPSSPWQSTHASDLVLPAAAVPPAWAVPAASMTQAMARIDRETLFIALLLNSCSDRRDIEPRPHAD